MRKTTWLFAGAISLAAAAAMAAQSEDLTPGPEQVSWARWQGRLSLGTSAPAWRSIVESSAGKLSGASIMSDYYFSRALVGGLGGLRATSGLIFGGRGVQSTGQPGAAAGNAFSMGTRLLGQVPAAYTAEVGDNIATLPYLGVGYTGLSARSGWSFSADLGLVAQSPGTARLGRVINGGQSLDDLVRDMRLAPLLQLGVSYSF